MEIHTVWAWSDWEWSDCPHCEWLPLRTLRSQKTLFEEGVFTSAHRNRRWIRWREWRRASSYLLPFPSDPVPALWDRKPAPWFFPPEKGLDTPPVFFRGGGRGGHRWAPAKLNVWGVELAHSALKRKKGGADRVFPCCNTLRSRQGCSEECVRACDLAVRSRYCWGTAAIEITGIAHGSSGWVGDGLALSPPAFPRSSALLGESLRCSPPPPLSESTLCGAISLQGDLYCFISKWLACCRGNACIMVILGSLYKSFTSDRVYLSGCLTAFNFEELIMHFIWLWKVIYIYIYVYIRADNW